jgi:hypothetical protein
MYLFILPLVPLTPFFDKVLISCIKISSARRNFQERFPRKQRGFSVLHLLGCSFSRRFPICNFYIQWNRDWKCSSKRYNVWKWNTKRIKWSDKAPDLYPRDTRFDFWPRSNVRYFLQLSHSHFLLHSFQFVTHDSLTQPSYVTERSAK